MENDYVKLVGMKGVITIFTDDPAAKNRCLKNGFHIEELTEEERKSLVKQRMQERRSALDRLPRS